MDSSGKEERMLREAKEYLAKHDRKKKRKHRRRDSDDSSSDDHKKKHKRSKKVSKKESKKESKKKKDKHRNKKVDLGDPLGHVPAILLDAERDYFAYHQHFWVYLYREEETTFDEIEDTTEARQAFARFVDRYNAGKLERVYYEGSSMPADVLEECRPTRHHWKFQTSRTEEESLSLLQDGVRKQTEYKIENKSDEKGHAEVCTVATSTFMPPAKRDFQAERIFNRRLKEHVKTAEEEFTGGRKEGRERQIEKRKERAERIHGHAKEKGAAIELSDEAIYGNDDQGYHTALQREKAREAQRREQRAARADELRQKEQEKQAAMLKQLGLTNIKPGEKITIKPREEH